MGENHEVPAMWLVWGAVFWWLGALTVWALVYAHGDDNRQKPTASE